MATAEKQLAELKTALLNNDYSAFQKILLQQALTLHMAGMDFMKKSEENPKMSYKQTCMDIAIRAFDQSLKSMRAVKEMGAGK